MKKNTSDPQIKMINDYGRCPRLLQKAIRGLADGDLDRSNRNQGWTIRQYIHHVVDGDDLWKSFIKQAIGNSKEPFELKWYWQAPNQEYWSSVWEYTNRPIAPSLALFRANRAHIVQILRQVPGSLGKKLTVCWPNEPEETVSVQDVVEMQIRHVEGHIADIQAILAFYREELSR